MSKIDWIFTLRKAVPNFLEQLKGKQQPGFFHYSLTGDRYDETYHWGLGNSVFATKIYATLNDPQLLEKEREPLAKFLKSFERPDGSFNDPLIHQHARLRIKLAAIKNWDFTNFFQSLTTQAETRQTLSALALLQAQPTARYQAFPQTRESIRTFLEKLNWEQPWGAGSHFSHLLFFLSQSDHPEKEDLVSFAIDWLDQLQHPADGTWYRGTPSLQQKVNGAMKVITGLKIAHRLSFHHAQALVDTALLASNDKHACDNFNVIYVLHYANQLTQASYRTSEIIDFAQQRLALYHQYYFPEYGGFSFKLHQANTLYYGAPITRGYAEPDIHGTIMFLWGITIIAQILGVDDQLGFYEITP